MTEGGFALVKSTSFVPDGSAGKPALPLCGVCGAAESAPQFADDG
jgi:hypothetical protein